MDPILLEKLLTHTGPLGAALVAICALFIWVVREMRKDSREERAAAEGRHNMLIDAFAQQTKAQREHDAESTRKILEATTSYHRQLSDQLQDHRRATEGPGHGPFRGMKP